MPCLGPSEHTFSRELVYNGPYCWTLTGIPQSMSLTMVDTMDNLFLKHHCCKLLQIDLVGNVKEEESVAVATPKTL